MTWSQCRQAQRAASPLRAWGTSRHRRPCYGFFLPYLVDGINLLRCTKSVLPFIAFQCLAQHLTQYLLACSKDLLKKELGQHTGGCQDQYCPRRRPQPTWFPSVPPTGVGLCVGCMCVGGVRVCLLVFLKMCDPKMWAFKYSSYKYLYLLLLLFFIGYSLYRKWIRS